MTARRSDGPGTGADQATMAANAVDRPETQHFLVRAIDSVERHGDAVDLALVAVRYELLAPLPGLITDEAPADQGLEQRLPNAPDLEGDDTATSKVDRPPVVSRRATLRVRAADASVLRLTLVPDGPWSPEADGLDDGILVDPQPGRGALEVVEEEAAVRISTPELSIRFRRRPFAFEVTDDLGRPLLRSGGDRRQVAGFPFAPALAFGAGHTSVSIELAPGEEISGLGEQFGSVVHNGQAFELVATDALGAGTGQVYKAAPVLHSSAGYTVFVHSPGPLTVSVGTPYPSLLEVDNEEDRLDLFVIGGDHPKARLTAYTALTGRMPVPPRWAFGVWMSRCRYRSRAELEEVAAELRSRQVPCDVLHIDPDWLERDLLNCDFVWSETKYPDPKTMLAELGAQGFHVSLWELPYLDTASPLCAEAEAAGYLVKGRDGRPAQVARTFSRDGRPRVLVDFSNPEARRFWKQLNHTLLDLGVAVLKCDFGEGLPDDAVMADGRPGRAWRNLYPFWYSRTVAEAVAEHTGRPPLVWSRSGWAGSQRYPAQWGGDPETSVAGLAAELRAGMSWALSAPGLWAHDVGGFYGEGPSPELYVRWAQVGCLSPLTRFHGLRPREPWAFGEEAFAIVQRFIQLRYRLLPYLVSAAGEASRFGWPVLRPLALEFPDEPALRHVEHEYLLGPDLLVVAVLDDGAGPAPVEIVLPSGPWADFWTGEVHAGPARFTRDVPLDRLPLFVRAGAIVPMGPDGQHTGEIPEDEWHLHCWPVPGSDGSVTTVYDAHDAYRYRLAARADHWASAHVEADEPAPRARTATLHLPGGLDLAVPVTR